MKTALRFLSAAALALAFALAAHAQTDSANVNAAIETAGAVGQPFIVSFAQSHPWLLTVLAAIATLRLVFKPIVTALEAYVKGTPQVTDDEWFAKVEHSRAFKVFAWLLDYLGSIKVGPQFTAKPEANSAGKPAAV